MDRITDSPNNKTSWLILLVIIAVVVIILIFTYLILIKSDLNLVEKIGEGSFGKVHMAHLKEPDGKLKRVAVKMVKSSATMEDIEALISEWKIMEKQVKHRNVLRCLGARINNKKPHELKLILEYCPYGSIESILRRNHDQTNTQTGKLNDWAMQVVDGMAFIHSQNIIHNDLAARNILLPENNIIKISDFGLARSLDENNIYIKRENGPMPTRWVALESLKERILSTATDVWQFGVVFWEFFSGGRKPYENLNRTEIVSHLDAGNRLEKPRFASKKTYDIMLECWNKDPGKRPSFVGLKPKLMELQ